MVQKSQFFAFTLLIALVLTIACGLTVTTSTAHQTPNQQLSRGLTPQERRGKALHMRGESRSGKEITAMLGEIDVPASTMNCAGCHGLRGEGKTEGGVTAGNLTWSNLLKPYGHTHPSGRKHGPFNESSFIRAVVNGIDPDGNNLLVAMPRFKMSTEDMADLIAYLKRIEADRDPGLTETSITVGTILPKDGAFAEISAAMKDVLTAYFANINDKGGIYNRRIELQTIDAQSDAAATAANMKTHVDNGEFFALVSGLSAGADKELAAVTKEAEIPLVGPVTLLTQANAQENRNLFYLLPGASQQARALVNFAAGKSELKKSPLAIVYSENELASAAATAIEDQARKSGWTTVTKKAFSNDTAALAGALKAEGVQTVFFLSANGEEEFINAAAAANWTPHVFLLGALTRKDLRVELRGRDTLPAMLLFVVAVFVVFHFSLPARSSDLAAGGLLWVAVLFTALLGLGRAFVPEREQRMFDGLVLAPSDRSAIWLAKALATFAFLALAELVALPVFALFFHGIGGATILAFLLADIGICSVGTLVGAMAVVTRARDLLLPLLFLPLAIPILIGGVGASVVAAPGRYLAFLALYDALFAVLCWASFEYVVTE